MSVSMLLKLMPWSLVRKVVMHVLEMVVDSTSNEIDDSIFDIVDNVLGDAEEAHPDED